MNKKYINNFFKTYEEMNNSVMTSFCEKIRYELINKTVEINTVIYYDPYLGYGINNSQRRSSRYIALKILKIKDIGFENIEETIGNSNIDIRYLQSFFIIDSNNIKHYVNNIFEFIDIDKLLNDFNKEQPYVTFLSLEKIEKYVGSRSKRKKLRISFIRKKHKKNKVLINTIVTKNVKLKKISLSNDENDNPRLLIYDGEKNHIVVDIKSINKIIISKEDPYGEENWDEFDV